jgi:hypothetical protein
VECCESELIANQAKCGWIYDTYGKNLMCPSGFAVAGFCGSNNNADCNDGLNFVGIQCCPPRL